MVRASDRAARHLSDGTQQPDAGPASTLDARVALAHDYLLVMRGAERAFAAIADLYPQAPIFTLLYDEAGTGGRFAGRSITTSALQRLGVGQNGFRRLLPLYPFAVERLRPSDCDVVVSSSSAFAHGIAVPSGAVHVCYCHAPFRYAWYEEARALSETPAPLRPLLRAQLRGCGSWDLAASRRVDVYVANSQLTASASARYYGREARGRPSAGGNRPLQPGDARRGAARRLRARAPQARARRARGGAPGARRRSASSAAGPSTPRSPPPTPRPSSSDASTTRALAGLYASARAVIVASREEFGITAVEAQAAGRPVIAAAAGGALETVLDGDTGLLVEIDDVEAFSARDREHRRARLRSRACGRPGASASPSPRSAAHGGGRRAGARGALRSAPGGRRALG